MPNTKIERILAQREAINARLRREQNKEKSAERRNETRCKILAGAVALEWAKRDSEFSTRFMAELGQFLVRDADRALFGLAKLEGATPQGEEPEIRQSA